MSDNEQTTIPPDIDVPDIVIINEGLTRIPLNSDDSKD